MLSHLRVQPEGRALVLHEDAAAAHHRVRLGLQLVAVVERLGQVEPRVEHQAVPEAVVALVVDERVRLDLRVLADGARECRNLVGAGSGELPLQQAVVVARAARGAAVGERLADVALEVEEPAGPDLVRDRVAVGRHGAVRRGELVQLLEGLLRPVVVGEVPERLLVAGRVLAVLDLLVVRLERDLSGAARARRRGDERCDLLDLGRRQLALEGRHAVSAVRDLPLDGLLVGAQLVEVRADRSFRAGRLHRVAARTTGGREDLRARSPAAAPGRPSRTTSSCFLRNRRAAKRERDEDERGQGEATHLRNIEAESRRRTETGTDSPRLDNGHVSMPSRPEYSLVVPIYNEEETTPGARAHGSRSWSTSSTATAEVILVDDGSSDRSYELMSAATGRRSAVQAAPPLAELRAPDRGHGRARRRAPGTR